MLLNKLYKGSDEVFKIYKGNTLIYDLTPSVSELKPTLTNFTIEDGQPSRVYFNSTSILDETKTSITGFSLYTGTPNEGTKSATGSLSINTGSLTGHYITLDSACDWSTIMTIDYDGTGNVGSSNKSVPPFTKEEIFNNIEIPAPTRTMFVSTTGGGDGTEIGSPWTMAQAASGAQAGDIIYIAPGTYTDHPSDGYVFNKSGNINAPIQYVGYNTTPGDDPQVAFNYPTVVDPDPNLMPFIDGQNTKERGINCTGSYVIFKNLQIANNVGSSNSTTKGQCFYASGGCDVVHVDNVFTKNSKRGMFFNSPSSARIHIKNSVCFGHYSKGILIGVEGTTSYNPTTLDGGNHRIYNTKVYDDFAVNGNETDYYIKISNVNSIISNCHIEKLSWDGSAAGHPGSGIVLKADRIPTEDNLIVDCTVKNMKLPVQARHLEVIGNVYRNVTVINDEVGEDLGGLLCVNGASYNTFENCKVIGGRWFSALNATDEYPNQVGCHHNKFINCISDGVSQVLEIDQYGSNPPSTEINNNEWVNCTFDGAANFISLFDTNLDNTNKFTNCIINDVTTFIGSGSGADSSVWNNNLFFNSFASRGTGAITGIDPSLDANFKPTATFTDIDVSPDNSAQTDYSGGVRSESLTTIGAVKHSDESNDVVTPPTTSQKYVLDGTSTSYFETDFDIQTLTDNNSFVYKGKLLDVSTMSLGGSKVNGEFYQRYVLGGSLQARYYDGATSDITASYTRDTSEHTFIFTVDSSINRLRVYVDGTLLLEETDAGFDGWDGRSSLFLIGARNNPAIENLNGELTDVQIYNKELTQAEITALSNDIESTTTGIVANFADNKVLNTWTDEVSGYIATNQGGITIADV